MVTTLGDQVIPLGRGRGSPNVRDPGEATRAADRLMGDARSHVLAGAHGCRLTIGDLHSWVGVQDPLLDLGLRVRLGG